ncbi:T9SS type A sorting domain-containing protein, partial [candidate division WOR-3 bacterium]|nr:T9SS type A sorting domain-containing protein [candidate division WOR-3 bacterium]
YSPYEYTSKPYSIITDTFCIDTIMPFNNSIISLNVKSMSDTSFVRIVSDYGEDTLRIYNNRDWKTIDGFYEGKNLKIIYCGKGDKAYFDDISIYSGNDSYNIFSSTNNYLFHKLEQGDYAVIVNAVDIKGNICNTGSIFEFAVIDSLKPYVYPNPASDFINIKTDIIGDYNINIFSSDGKNIINKTGQTDSGLIRIGFDDLNLKTGIYFFTINSKKGKFAIIK